MRWLLLKDLQVLRRSPLTAALLVLYPAVIAVLVGFALSRGPDKPRVAFLSQVPERDALSIGGREFDVLEARGELFQRLEIVEVSSRGEARRKVRNGDVLGALILPEDLVSKLEAGGLAQPRVEVLVNEEDPVKARLVEDRIAALLSEANQSLSAEFTEITLEYLGLLLRGGEFNFLGRSLDVLGLTKAEAILEQMRRGFPAGSARRRALDEVIDFSRLARQNLDLSDQLLSTVSQPIKVKKTVVEGDATPLTTFAIAVAATITLMFVTVLLVAGSLALEREENAFTRLTRGLITGTAVLVEKVVLGVICSLAVTMLMLGGLGLFVDLEWERALLWPVAITAGAAGFAALGAAIGGLTREVRAASLLAFMISLPIAFLSLVPSGAVSPTLFDVIEAVAALFPFAPTLDAVSGALNESGPGLGGPLLHLVALAAGYGALARLSLRRFA